MVQLFVENRATNKSFFDLIYTEAIRREIDRSNENSEIHEIYKRHYKNPENSEISKILRLFI